MSVRFAILGSGAWGIAVAVHLARKPGTAVCLWSARAETAAKMLTHRENAAVLPGVKLPDAITITADVNESVTDADYWIIAIPTIHLTTTLARFANVRAPMIGAISLTKGIENTTFRRPTEILATQLPNSDLAVLCGPSHAEEVARWLPTSLVVASSNLAFAQQVQDALGSDRFRIYSSNDVIGVELAGALKNVIGLAAGVCDGLGFGDNAKAALLTRGIVEMTRFGVALGADPATFGGLAGQGDLIATCFSRHGRNRRAGERLAKGEPLGDILAGAQIVEGVYTAKSVHDRAAAMGLDLPIMQSVYELLYENKPPALAVKDLMTRAQRREERW
ncbi:NAD(P)H-dependent glycerol-3-phosphate dehydrogenase [soil metagenome]